MFLTLVKKRRELKDVQSFLFQADQEVKWIAGQFIRYTIKDPKPDERRAYRFFSIASAPFEKLLMLTTRFSIGDGSSFKKDLLNLKIGDKIEGDEPEGDFVIKDPAKSYIFIAGGIGITSFRSIILDLNHKNLPINITLLYANRAANFIFKSELEKVQKKHTEFKIKYFTDPERINEKVVKSLLVHGSSLIFYISGPEQMVEYYEAMLYKLGIPKNLVQRDYFHGYTEL